MITVHFVAADGTHHAVAAGAAQSLMRAAVAAGIDGIVVVLPSTQY